jgi:glyoxylase-like metal-dependent hydrolase (beta-lactamase superfamily II)
MVPKMREARRLYVFRSGGERTLRALFDPWDRSCGETMEIPYYFFAIDHPAGWTLVDCGISPALAADPVGRLGDQAEMSELLVGPDDDVAQQLTAVGIIPEQVAHVVLTHMHYDHCGGLRLLPAATVHVQAAERAFAQAPPAYLWNPDALLASWEELEARRDRASATLLFSHYPASDQVVLAPEAWHP